MLCKVKVMFYYTEKKFKFKYLNTFVCSAKFQTYGDDGPNQRE